jgi:prolyl oligopeptidase
MGKVDFFFILRFTSIVWSHDNLGFFYSRYPEPSTDKAGTETDANKFSKVYYHRIGTNQIEDILIYENEQSPDSMFSCDVSDCGYYLLLTEHQSTENVNKLYMTKLSDFKISTICF